jgi:hypothetical protein
MTPTLELDPRNREFAWPDHEGPFGFVGQPVP